MRKGIDAVLGTTMAFLGQALLVISPASSSMMSCSHQHSNPQGRPSTITTTTTIRHPPLGPTNKAPCLSLSSNDDGRYDENVSWMDPWTHPDPPTRFVASPSWSMVEPSDKTARSHYTKRMGGNGYDSKPDLWWRQGLQPIHSHQSLSLTDLVVLLGR